MELGKLTHAVSIDILTVRNAVIFVFVALTLILRLLFFVLVVVPSLVEQRRIGVVQNVLRVRPNLA